MPHEEPTTRAQAPDRMPFREAWEAHREAGWEPLPLPVLRKSPPPQGATGAHGVPLSLEALERVAASERPWNIGVRAPLEVIGVDVDAYGAKPGELSLRRLEAALGRLPLTVMTTRRFPADETSGIRWFRLGEGIDSSHFPGVLGQGIEVIRYGHRYGVAAGSRVHWDDKTMTGPVLTYLAVDMRTGESSLDMPRVDSLPFLPTKWLEHLQAQSSEPWNPEGDPAEWLRDGECARVNELVAHFMPASLNGSRHDAMIATVAGIARLGAMGHFGTIMAIEYVRHAFLSSVAGEPRRDAEAEFRRALEGLAAKLAGARQEACRGPLCGVVQDMTEELTGEAWEAPTEAPVDRRALAIEAEAEKMRIREAAKEIVTRERLEAQWDAAPAMSATELLSGEYETGPDLIEGLIPEKGVVLLTAERKAGKTTLLLNVAKSLIDSVPFLGRKPRELERNVMLMDLEMSPNMLQAWLKRMSLENLDRLRIMPVRGKVASTFSVLASDFRPLAEMVRAQNVEVLILDPLAPLLAVLGWDENSNSDVRRALTILSDFAEAAGVSEIILAHHTGWQTDGRARGAAAFEDTPDNLWRLQVDASEGFRTFSTRGRIADMPRTILELDEITGKLYARETLTGYEATTKLTKRGAVLREILMGLEGEEIVGRDLCSSNGQTRAKDVEILRAWAQGENPCVAIRREYVNGKEASYYRWIGPQAPA